MKPCPNPECEHDDGCDWDDWSEDGSVRCFCACGMCGPFAQDMAGATRLWDLLPRDTDIDVRRAIRTLLEPTPEAEAALAELGITVEPK